MKMSRNQFGKTSKMMKDKKLITIALILTLALSASSISIPVAQAKTSVSLDTIFTRFQGINTPTLINWRPTPEVFKLPPYDKVTSAWSNAIVTFTRPDNSIDTVPGPFTITSSTPGRAYRDIELVYTPNMKGTWAVNFTWPGDDVYTPITKIDTFTVGDHIPMKETFPMLSIRPYPVVGLNQQVLVNAWVTPPPETQRAYYRNYTFTFIQPNGTVAYVFSMDSEAPGTCWFEIPLNLLGNWTLKFDFPGDYIHLPCSITRTVTVKETPIPYPVADTPLPTESWDFPINVNNREWRNIAGPWYRAYYNYSGGSYNPYTEAPETAHILWKSPPASGVGGFIGSNDQYKGIETTGIYTSTALNIRTVMAGRGYYTAGGNIICVDMTNGKQLWSVPGSFAVGATRSRAPVLYNFGNNFTVFDALTGSVLLNVTGMPLTLYDDPYVFTQTSQTEGGRLICWNVTSNTANFAERVIWNISTPFTPMYTQSSLPTESPPQLIQSGMLIRQKASDAQLIEGFIAVNETTGALVYNTTVLDLSNPSTWFTQQGPAQGSGYGLYYRAAVPVVNQGLGYVAFNASTGKLAWVSEKTEYPWGNFWAYTPQASAYGMIYGLGYSGVYGFNVTNGKIVWHYAAGNSGMETPYNTWTFGSVGPVIGGGIVFAPNTEHSPTLYYRGNRMHALNALTGEEVWSMLGYYTPTAIAYGILLATETPSGYTFAFGKGETATTVSVQNDVYSKGSSILIKGTVTDQSPSQPGTAALSDESMSTWMAYLHMQQPKPTNATGVTVKLTAVDQSGNKVDIGTTATDSSGLYAFTWTPSSTGTYKITASFEGSNSYYASYDETPIAVVAAPAASIVPTTAPPTSPSGSAAPTTAPPTSPTQSESPQPTETSPSPSQTVAPPPKGAEIDLYMITAVVVIIIVAIAAAAIILRRRK